LAKNLSEKARLKESGSIPPVIDKGKKWIYSWGKTYGRRMVFETTGHEGFHAKNVILKLHASFSKYSVFIFKQDIRIDKPII